MADDNKVTHATKRKSTAHNIVGRAGRAPHRRRAAAPPPPPPPPPKKQTNKAQAEATKATAGGGGGQHPHQHQTRNNKGTRATKSNSTAHNTAGRAGRALHRHGAAAPPPPPPPAKTNQKSAGGSQQGDGAGGTAPPPAQDTQQQRKNAPPKGTARHTTPQDEQLGHRTGEGKCPPQKKQTDKVRAETTTATAWGGGGCHNHQQKIGNHKGTHATKKNSTARNTAGRADRAPHRHGAAAPPQKKEGHQHSAGEKKQKRGETKAKHRKRGGGGGARAGKRARENAKRQGEGHPKLESTKSGGQRGRGQKKRQAKKNTTRQGGLQPGGRRAKKKDKTARGKVRRTKTRPGCWPARPGQEEHAHANTHGTQAWRPPTGEGRCQRPHETAPVHRPISPSTNGRYGKPKASVTGSTHAKPPRCTQRKTDAAGTRREQPHRGASNRYNAERAQRPCLRRGQQQAQ